MSFITVGKNTRFNGSKNMSAESYAKITIGDYCAIADGFMCVTVNHDYNYPALSGMFYKNMWNTMHPGEIPPYTKARTKGHVNIGNDVWIANGVIVLSGVTIGDGCCIGARSVVTKDLPPYTICVGNPCKPIKNRYNDDMTFFLLDLKWWNWDEDKIKKNKSFFKQNLNEISVDEVKKIIK